MVTVAKGIDAPIKILSPRSSTQTNDFAMLGLGDIVVPGLVIALCLRFDLHRHALKHPKSNDVTPYSKFGKSYFVVAVLSYIFGLGVTMGVMHWTRHAQPALLYLSPACSKLNTIWILSQVELTRNSIGTSLIGFNPRRAENALGLFRCSTGRGENEGVGSRSG